MEDKVSCLLDFLAILVNEADKKLKKAIRAYVLPIEHQTLQAATALNR